MTARIGAYGTWLADSHDIPKLLLTFDSSPTLLSTPEVAAWCKDNIAGPADRALRPAGHHATEDQPEAIATAIVTWLDQQNPR